MARAVTVRFSTASLAVFTAGVATYNPRRKREFFAVVRALVKFGFVFERMVSTFVVMLAAVAVLTGLPQDYESVFVLLSVHVYSP